MKRVQGFGLAEILFSLLLASFMASALIQLYVSVKEQYGWFEKRLKKQQELFYLKNFFVRLIHNAGYWGCQSKHFIQLRYPYQQIDNDGLTLLKADDRTLPAAIARTCDRHSAILRVTYLEEPLYRVTHIGSDPHYIKTKQSVPFSLGDRVAISDCFQSQVNSIKKVGKTGHNVTLQYASPTFTKTPFIARIHQDYVYVRKKGDAKFLYYYHRNRSERLTDDIKTMAVAILRTNTSTTPLVHVKLLLDAPFDIYVSALNGG